MTRTLAEIGHDIRTQDNRITALPVFVVQQKRRVYGMDPAYSDEIVWVDSDGEALPEEVAALDAEYEETGDEPDGWTRTSYIDVWEFVTCCFTENGCNDYIEANRHNLKEPRVYAYSGHRNREWETVRDYLAAVNE